MIGVNTVDPQPGPGPCWPDRTKRLTEKGRIMPFVYEPDDVQITSCSFCGEELTEVFWVLRGLSTEQQRALRDAVQLQGELVVCYDCAHEVDAPIMTIEQWLIHLKALDLAPARAQTPESPTPPHPVS